MIKIHIKLCILSSLADSRIHLYSVCLSFCLSVLSHLSNSYREPINYFSLQNILKFKLNVLRLTLLTIPKIKKKL